jgi:hypothetical protein
MPWQHAICSRKQWWPTRNIPCRTRALADAWTALGYDAKAKAEATNAFQLSGSFPGSRILQAQVEADAT